MKLTTTHIRTAEPLFIGSLGKKATWLVMILALSTGLMHAQQDVMTGQYLFNEMLVNPAATGVQGQWQTMALQRLQWVEFDGAPNTSVLSAHGGLANRDLGVGGSLSLDAIGITSTLELSANASYHLDLNTSTTMSFGLRGGLLQYRANLSDVVGIDPADPVYQGAEIGAWIPRFGFGMRVEGERWHVGAAAPMLFVLEQSLTQGIQPYYRNHLYLHGGMRVEANSWLKLHPSMLLRATPEIPAILDLNVLATVQDMYTAGICYRTGSGITLVTQFQASPQFRLGYMRDFATTEIRSYAGGTHEVFLGWNLASQTPQIAMPQGM
ncbi:MAG: type IX secretion system membrane protein PorP/SprF [Bacteroidetes bacterium]|nr:type IX secretion system membrane protein PorP/SprF [Bacteroidota bacterium]MDA0904073.1 type IX secretion system membrane protein PorP/SprF [Bacteroidota bacterium]MDA1243194.1 type IX secretion system membrane protein PorP/SprF [Bacteroidota bacterium]